MGTPPLQDLPEQDHMPSLGWERPLGGGCRALLTLVEVSEDVVHAELGSRRTHLGVAVAEAADAALQVVGLQVKRARAASEMEAGGAQGAKCVS